MVEKIKRLLPWVFGAAVGLAMLTLIVPRARAQFIHGQILTAAQLNNMLANPNITGGSVLTSVLSGNFQLSNFDAGTGATANTCWLGNLTWGNCVTASGGALSVAKGTIILSTTAISSATCSSEQTAAATGVLTTDVLQSSFSGDPTALTGYIPATSGMLTIIGYTKANAVAYKVCNNTGGSITPGELVLNWQVTR